MFTTFQQLLGVLNSTSAVFIAGSFIFLLGSIFLFYKNQKLSIWLLFLCALCLGLGFSCIDAYIHLWDEQYHALVAKNLAETPLTPRLYPEVPLEYNYKVWVINHVWLHKPPLSLWQMALSIKFFGANYFAVRLPSVIMHAVLVFVVFRMGRLLYTEKIAYIAAIVFAFLNYPLELVAGHHTSEHIDVAFLFYVTLSLWAWLEYYQTKKLKWIVLVGVFSGAAILTKWLVGLLVYGGAGIVHLVFKENRTSFTKWKQLTIAGVITALVVIPWHIYTYYSFPNEYAHEMAYNTAHFFEVIELHDGDAYFYWDNLNTLYGNGDFIQWLILISVISIPFFTKHRAHSVFLVVVLLAPYLFFTLAATKMTSFCVIVSPLIILVTVAFLIGLINKIPKFHNIPYKRFLEGLTILILSIVLLRPKEVMINHKLDSEYGVMMKSIYEASQKGMQQIKLDPGKKYALSHTNKLPEEMILWMFYQDNVVAYEGSFSEDKQKQLLDLGYTLKEVEWNGNTPVLLNY